MNILTIDTVLDKSYISFLLNEKEIYKTVCSDEKNYHSAYLIKVLSEILKENSLTLDNIDYLGVNTGVGSFTGIRVGLAIVKVISNRLNIKVCPVETFEVLKLAFNTPNIFLDARRNSVFYNTGNETKIIPFSLAKEILLSKNEVFITDLSLFNNSEFADFQSKMRPFEKENKNLAKYELTLVKEKIQRGMVFKSSEIKPFYIQTPPIFLKN